MISLIRKPGARLKGLLLLGDGLFGDRRCSYDPCPISISICTSLALRLSCKISRWISVRSTSYEKVVQLYPNNPEERGYNCLNSSRDLAWLLRLKCTYILFLKRREILVEQQVDSRKNTWTLQNLPTSGTVVRNPADLVTRLCSGQLRSSSSTLFLCKNSRPCSLITILGQFIVLTGFLSRLYKPIVLNKAMVSTVAIPQVTLDTTLAELYALDDEGTGAGRSTPAHLNAFPCSDCAMTTKIPRNERYLYQDSELVKPWTAEERQRLRRILAIKILNVLGQRYSFVCGDLNVMVFDPENHVISSPTEHGIASSEYAKAEVEKTLSVLVEHQRPKIHMIAGLAAAKLPPNVSKIAVAMPFDGLDHIPHLLPPDRHYELLSKACLANSRLPTPRAEVITFEPTEELLAITNRHQGFFPNDLDSLNFEQRCTFQSCVKQAAETLVNRMLAWEIPFVVKSQQSSSGGGTYLVRSEDERTSCIVKMKSTALPVLVSSINSSNKHLLPADLIITDYIPAIRSSGVSFFVTQNGHHHFLSATRQDFDDGGFWTGGSIDYEIQHQERERFDDTISKAARFLNDKGYYGPVGIDVLEDTNAQQFIVDMNVRVPGSLPLGLLGHFFYLQRGLQHGYIILGTRFAITREAFLQAFQAQVEAGQIVIIAWYEDRSSLGSGVSWTNLAMAEKTVERLAQLKQLIFSHSLGAHE